MKNIALEIENTVERHAWTISAMTEEEMNLKKSPEKWSVKEIVGHLIDSAQNNIQRFVRGQYEDTPRISYSQNDWVLLQDYQNYKKDDLVQLWILINKHLCRILVAMDIANYEKNCNTGKSGVELHSLTFLAKDYLVHLLHHLNQIEREISIK